MSETILILPNGEELKFPYYEFGSFLESYIHQWMTLSKQNKEEFDLFKKEYHTLTPYLDFAICHLDFKIKNPLIKEESILMGESDKLVIKRKNYSSIPYKRITDENYHIEKVSPYYLTSCAIDINGIKYDINYDEQFHHDDLFELLLIENIINNKKLYDDYLLNIEHPLSEYFRCRLGFTQVAQIERKPAETDDLKISIIPEIPKKEFIIVHNKELNSKWLNELMEVSKDIYNIKEYKEEYTTKEMSDKNESRRI